MQKKTLQITLTVLFLAFALTLTSTWTVAAAPTVDTDKPIYLYWNVEGDVTIFGSGYDATKTYAVFITYPGGVAQQFSTFKTVTDFEYIHPLVSPYPAGTYFVQIREIGVGVVASCHFGVWGIDSSIYNRGESITVSGGGVDPLSTVAIDIYHDGDGDLATTGDQTQMDPDYWGAITDPTADPDGEFMKLVDVPDDAWVSDGIDAIYFVEITYDSYDFGGTTETGLTDTQTFEVSATYTITWTTPAAAVIRNRGHTQDFDFSVADASGDPVSGLTSLYLDKDGDLTTTEDQYGVPITEVSAGAYTGSWVVPSDAPTGPYDCIVVKSGNRGETADYVTVSDLIMVDLAVGAGTYGGLETIYFDAVIDYEDGADFTDMDGIATANIWIDVNDDGEIDAGEFVVDMDVPLLYDSVNDLWYRYYDLYPPGAIVGTYKIKIYASDPNGNSGTDTVTFDVVPETKKDDHIGDPIRGPVGGEVDIWGSGFAPDTDVLVAWYMSITGDFVGVGDGETTEFPLTIMDFVVPGSEKIYVDGVLQTIDEDYEINYDLGVITFTVPPPAGMPQAVVITADYDVMIALAMTTTNEYGSFATTFTVPESYACEHEVWAIQRVEPEPLYAIDIYCVEPQIVLSSTKGPPEAWITVTGTGFAPNEEVDIWVEYWYEGLWHLVDEWSWVFADTDAYGTFSQAILLPTLSLQAMYHELGIAYSVYMICAQDFENYAEDYYLAVLFCEPSVIDVKVETGALYFPGEVFTVYALTSVDGVPMDVHDITFLLYYETLGPIPLSQLLPVVHVDTGLYAVTTTLPPDIGPGNYLIVVTATKSCWMEFYVIVEGYGVDSLEWEATINGVGMDGCIISPTLMGMNAMLIGIEGDIATINTNIGLIQLDLAAINAKLSSIQGSIATIETNIGTIQTDISTINGAISSIQGNIVTITSDLGTITTDISSINGHIATIEGDIATVTSELGEIEVKAEQINATVTAIHGKIAVIESTVGVLEDLDISAINATLEDIQGRTVTIQTTLGTVQEDIGNLDAALVAIHGDTAEILVRIGTPTSTIFTELSSIKARITEVEEDVATIETDIGTIKVDLTDIITKITVTNDNVATIETDIGTIKGRLTSIEGDVATVETDIGTIKTTTDSIETTGESIKTDTSLQTVTIALSLIAAIAAIAAAVMVLRKVYVK